MSYGRSGRYTFPRPQRLHRCPGGFDREAGIIASRYYRSSSLSQRGDILTMGLHHPRGRSENRRESISCQTGHSRHTAPWTPAGSRSGSGCRGTRHDGTSPHACLTIRIGSQHSGAKEAWSIPLVSLL